MCIRDSLYPMRGTGYAYVTPKHSRNLGKKRKRDIRQGAAGAQW